MSSNWTKKSLGEVSSISSGNSAPQKQSLFKDGKYPFFRTSDIGQVHIGKIIESRDHLNDEGIKKLMLFSKDTIVLPKSGASTFLDHRVVLAVDGYVSSHLATINVNKAVLNTDFLFYYLTTIESKNLIQDNKYPSLKLSDISNIEVVVPQLSEQKQIVSILDEVFEGIAKAKANAEKNLANAREIFESYLQSVFSRLGDEWTEKTFGDKELIQFIDGDRGKNYPKKSDFSDEGFCVFLNTKNVLLDGFDFKRIIYITERKDKELGNGKLVRNDVIMTTRGTIGNLGVYNNDVKYNHVRINSGMLIFRPNTSKILPEYLFEVLRSGIVRTQIDKLVSGAAQPQLPIKTLLNFKIPVPNSLTKQKEIVGKLQQLFKLKLDLLNLYEKKTMDLEELKKSILQKAFSGDLIRRAS